MILLGFIRKGRGLSTRRERKTSMMVCIDLYYEFISRSRELRERGFL